MDKFIQNVRGVKRFFRRVQYPYKPGAPATGENPSPALRACRCERAGHNLLALSAVPPYHRSHRL
jgi:hypothetical protein